MDGGVQLPHQPRNHQSRQVSERILDLQLISPQGRQQLVYKEQPDTESGETHEGVNHAIGHRLLVSCLDIMTAA
ncbi:MAG: hypothetical protein ACREYC_25710 [Gammaproteobacteria bacterium]